VRTSDARTVHPAASAVDVARSALGDRAEWLQLSADAPPPEAVRLDQLLADDARLLDELLARQRERYSHEPPEYAAGVVGAVAWMVYAPILASLCEHRRRPLIAAVDVLMRFPTVDDEVDQVWWPAATPLIDVADLDTTLRELVAEAIEFLTPLVDAVRARTPVGRRGLWGRVVDVFASVGPSYEHVEVDRRTADLQAFRRAAAGTVLDQPIELVDIARPEGTRRMVRTVACCFAYKADSHDDDEHEQRPWDGGEWARYCMSCPLIPVEETILRANYWLDQTPAT
jgi:hypothetical protein